MAEAGQQVDVGGPWADAVNRGERHMRHVGGNIAQRREREIAARHGAGDFLERFYFRRRQAEPRQPGGARPQNGLGRERIERRGKPAPDRARACRR